MFFLDIFEDFQRRFVRIDLLGRFREDLLLAFQLCEADFENFVRRKIDQLGLSEKSAILLFSQRPVPGGFR